ncbi:uncharacterized protein EI97DRAFT_430341 [Westerdykella ornata]|uniref:Uncharacterized protein n=1 Tax=Westerdykella ornata TaxID=318751 RepID=A0A6A6JSK9_WESOR|nr:uncharacterized protein EI97DRAFT_430341 [Westerdykella ornata]KAF2279244.1 hypothetical protein EI97DRAFT_430341 [Westerdykella ornata]
MCTDCVRDTYIHNNHHPQAAVEPVCPESKLSNIGQTYPSSTVVLRSHWDSVPTNAIPSTTTMSHRSLQPPKSPYPSLPASPRANRSQLFSINTDVCNTTTPPMSEKTVPQDLVDRRGRRRDSLVFIDATIPTSPLSSTSTHEPDAAFDGLVPRRRNGFARLFSCFGREERARRRTERHTEYVKVGEDRHWTEL